jgi:hypothetical protein
VCASFSRCHQSGSQLLMHVDGVRNEQDLLCGFID